jgi:predicted RNase H-like nuclease (RuvC/YqgF family)
MANPIIETVKRLRTENATLHRAAQEQERAILELRSQLSMERAALASLRKKTAAKEK